jgi:hypothetical protein
LEHYLLIVFFLMNYGIFLLGPKIKRSMVRKDMVVF